MGERGNPGKLMMSAPVNDKIKAILRELKCRFQESCGDRLVQMRLGGSQARGDAGAGSPIDVLYQFNLIACADSRGVAPHRDSPYRDFWLRGSRLETSF